jgi:23S rRNA (cytidine1920-2'-O)/16S rRNA (cytidine1409-2'-O)-methyltransferase
VDGAPATKAAHMVTSGQALAVKGPGPRYVGRGGEKLAAALARFEIAVDGRRALDVGSSTGGFTDCLLQAGAASVVAVDVGRNQLHERLRDDPRVESHERTDVRALDVPRIGEGYPLVVADLSFISLRTVAGTLVDQAADGADVVVLVKPQFEVGRAEASRGRGVVTDPDLWRGAVSDVIAAFEDRGAAIMDLMVSPLQGADGNVEFLLHVRTGAEPRPSAGLVGAAIADAVGLRP